MDVEKYKLYVEKANLCIVCDLYERTSEDQCKDCKLGKEVKALHYELYKEEI